MRKNHYVLTFESGKTVFASAISEEEAVIIAQAVMFKNGMNYKVKSIHKTTNISDMTDTDYIA